LVERTERRQQQILDIEAGFWSKGPKGRQQEILDVEAGFWSKGPKERQRLKFSCI
jgi:hypothetical protein